MSFQSKAPVSYPLTLNTTSVLHEYLSEAGIQHVRFVPEKHISNDSKEIIVLVSYEKFSRLNRAISQLLRYKDSK